MTLVHTPPEWQHRTTLTLKGEVRGCHEGGDTTLHRVIEAELWGVHSTVETGVDGLKISQATGAYGTLFEITCRLPWTISGLVDYVARFLPSGVSLCKFDHHDDGEDYKGVLIVHYWLEARSRIASATAAPPSVSKPSI